jgi:hypothetical protein
MLPDRKPAPLPGLDDLGVGLLYERPDPGERVAAPVAKLRDPRVDQLGSANAFNHCDSSLQHTVRVVFRAVDV